jgi:hypothetical protein
MFFPLFTLTTVVVLDFCVRENEGPFQQQRLAESAEDQQLIFFVTAVLLYLNHTDKL